MPEMNISSPTLLLDKQKTWANIQRMYDKAHAHNLTLKPHFKTHQSPQIGKWFKEIGIQKITVSSIDMAEYFADLGWTDITIAFPCNIRVAHRLDKLAARVELTILISDPNTVLKLKGLITHNIHAYIEIDTGAHRTGFEADNISAIENVVQAIFQASSLSFKGFYSHPGHSYAAQCRQEIQSIHDTAVEYMQHLKNHFKAAFPNIKCCLGDTPCCSMADNWEGIDEISPGNFVFFDVMQAQIGSCGTNDISVALACPVVATYPERLEIVVHGGAVHLSKDSIIKNSRTLFGKVVPLNDDLTWGKIMEGCFLKAISQEHGIIACSKTFFDEIEIGDIIGILPVHSCLTADAMKEYVCTKNFDRLAHMQA